LFTPILKLPKIGQMSIEPYIPGMIRSKTKRNVLVAMVYCLLLLLALGRLL